MNTPRSAQLVHVPVPGIEEPLCCAWYTPVTPTDTALLHLHGKGGNFYTGPSLFVPHNDTAAEFAHLSLNMRCHDLGYTRYDLPMPDVQEGVVQVGGGMWERIGDGVPDVLAGMAWLRERGYARILLVGHSSGGYYAAQVSADHQDQAIGLTGVALLSTVISYKRNLEAWFPGELLAAALERAGELVAVGAGHSLLATEAWYYAISATSLLERAALPDGEFERLLGATQVPLLFVCGAQEPRVPQWRALYEGMTTNGNQWLVLPGVSHDYSGQERELTEQIAAFVRRTA